MFKLNVKTKLQLNFSDIKATTVLWSKFDLWSVWIFLRIENPLSGTSICRSPWILAIYVFAEGVVIEAHATHAQQSGKFQVDKL